MTTLKQFLIILLCFCTTLMNAQFKVIKFGAKAGVNYPQASLSTQDVLNIYADQTYDILKKEIIDLENKYKFKDDCKCYCRHLYRNVFRSLTIEDNIHVYESSDVYLSTSEFKYLKNKPLWVCFCFGMVCVL